jgi:2-isopropylmalate synthase
VTDDTGKEVDAAQIKAIFDREYGIGADGVQHARIDEAAAGSVTVNADVRLAEGRLQKLAGIGNGPIDAFVAALQEFAGTPIRVLDYHEHAIDGGADARAVAYIELRIGEATLFGVGIDRNIVTASLNAVLSGWRRTRSTSAVDAATA